VIASSFTGVTFSDNVSDAFSSEKATQFYWGTPEYKSLVRADQTVVDSATQVPTYVWSADVSNVKDWETDKVLSVNNKYTQLWSEKPGMILVAAFIDGAKMAQTIASPQSKDFGSEDGVLYSFDKTIEKMNFAGSITKSGTDVLVSVDISYNEGCAVENLVLEIEFWSADWASAEASHTQITVNESGTIPDPEQYVLGDSHLLTVNVTGMKSNNVTLIDMGNRMELISGHEIGEHIVSPDSIVTSRVAKQNNTIISSGSNVQSGTFVGIYAEAPYMEDAKAGVITIMCGQTAVGYYYISNTSESLKQCMFRMPDGDAVVSIVYNTVHVTSQCDNGSVSAKRNINNVWSTDEYFFEGETVMLSPFANQGYVFDSYEVMSGDVSISNGRFVVGDSDVVIAAKFVEKEYTISITQAVGGTVEVSKLKAKMGETITLDVTTSKGYSLASLSSGQIPTMTKDTRSFTMPASNVSIIVVYEQMVQLSYVATQSSGMTTLDVSVAAKIGVGMEDPVFLIAGTYDGDIVVNAYSHIKVGTDHIERVSFSSYGLQEIFVQLVEGISSDPTGYFCVYTVGTGA
jgi:hypothetical protein